jgi:hypothetical protein
MLNRRTTALLSAGTGVCLELGIHALSGRREAWDSPLFWTLGLPTAALASAAIGYFARPGDWRWTALVVPGQVMAMIARSGELSGGLWPLTVALSAILSAPFVLASFVGSRFRRPISRTPS